MGVLQSRAITDRGRILLADVQAGAVFIPTKIVIGSGNIPVGSTAANLTAVVSPVIDLVVSKHKKSNDGKVTFGGVYTNATITQDFYFRELALYARAEYRDAEGNVTKSVDECLYTYGHFGDTADLMPAYSSSTVVERNIDIVTWVGNETQVDLTVASGLYVPQEEFASHASQHRKDGADPLSPADIDAAPAGFGLGTGGASVENNDANNAIVNGWYQCKVNTPTGDWCDIFVTSIGDNFSVTQFAFDRYQFLGGNAAYYWMRTKRNNHSFTEWEIVNPPMTQDEEYRTTERIAGKVVYKRNVNGFIQYRLEGETTWKDYAKAMGAPADHNHDERYYTETEVNQLLSMKAPTHTWGTEDIEAGSPSPWATGVLSLVIE